MKHFGLGLGLLVAGAVVAAPAFADDFINKAEFQKAADGAGDMSFNISLAQTARLLDYCGDKPKAQEVRNYLQPVTSAVAQQKFKSDTPAVRGMFLSRNIGASMSSEVATIALLEQLDPLTDAQKTKICGFANEGYTKVMELKNKTAPDGKAGVTQGAKLPPK